MYVLILLQEEEQKSIALKEQIGELHKEKVLLLETIQDLNTILNQQQARIFRIFDSILNKEAQ